jgi:3-mercaptopyruvate sulfurtransferase SseA
MNTGIRTIAAVLAVIITTGTLWFVNRPVTPYLATMQDVKFEAQKGAYRLINLEELWERYRQSPEEILLVDTRQEWEHRSGHIKGSVNFPMEPTWWSRWSKQDELREFLGPDTSRFVVFF